MRDGWVGREKVGEGVGELGAGWGAAEYKCEGIHRGEAKDVEWMTERRERHVEIERLGEIFK